MAAQTFLRALQLPDTAGLRLFWQIIKTQLLAGGWVQTSDTGQIDWTTVTLPAVNTLIGYEIFRTNDAGGSLANFYVKFEYWTNAGSTDRPRIKVQFGWGSNGTGTLTGILSTQVELNANTITSASLQNCNLAAGAGWFCFHIGQSAANFGYVISVERLKDANRNDTNNIYIFTHTNTAGGYKDQVFNQTIAYTQRTGMNNQSGGVTFTDPYYSQSPQNSKVAVGFLLPWGETLLSPAQNILGCGGGQIGVVQGITTHLSYGTTKTYIVNAYSASQGHGFAWGGGVAVCFLTRFE